MTKANSENAHHVAVATAIEGDLNAIRRAIHKPLEAEIARSPLTAPQTAAMRIVVNSAGISLKDLSLAMGLAHSTVSGIVDRLNRDGLVKRVRDAKDGRISTIHPTKTVTQFVREKIPVLRRGPLTDALATTTQSEREQIANAIHRLRELLEKDSADGD